MMTHSNAGERHRALSARMDFDHVITVDSNGDTDDALNIWAPSVTLDVDNDGQIIAGAESRMIEQLRTEGWEPLNGYSGQYGYSGPVMHASEFIGGGLARDILDTPGTYVLVSVECESASDDDDSEPAGWMVLRSL